MFKKLEKACRRKFSEVSSQNKSRPLQEVLLLAIKLHFKNDFRNAAQWDLIISIFIHKMLTILITFNLITGRLSMTKSKLTSALILNKLEDRNTLSPNPLLMYSAIKRDSENADR